MTGVQTCALPIFLHLQETQGKIVTNPNCSTVFLASALAPLARIATIESVSVVTLQALSGAGYPGVPCFDLLGNIIPHIQGEEDKIKEEVKKILGQPGCAADFRVTVHVHRVPVLHGHTVAAHVRFQREVSVKEALEAIEGPDLFQRCIFWSDACSDSNPCLLHETWKVVKIGRAHV